MTWEQRLFEAGTGSAAGLIEQDHAAPVIGPAPDGPAQPVPLDHPVARHLANYPDQPVYTHRVDGAEVEVQRAVLIETPTPGSEARGLPNAPAAEEPPAKPARKKRAAVAPTAKKPRR